MRLFNKYKKTIIFLVVVVVLFSAYNFLFTGDGAGDALLTSEGPGSSTAGKEILSFLLEIRSINLDQDFFNSASFNTLIDFSQEIEAQPVGRSNPFAPIGVDIEFSPTDDLEREDLDLGTLNLNF